MPFEPVTAGQYTYFPGTGGGMAGEDTEEVRAIYLHPTFAYATVEPGDVSIAAIAWGPDSTTEDPSIDGFTELATVEYGTGPYYIAWYYRILDGTETHITFRKSNTDADGPMLYDWHLRPDQPLAGVIDQGGTGPFEGQIGPDPEDPEADPWTYLYPSNLVSEYLVRLFAAEVAMAGDPTWLRHQEGHLLGWDDDTVDEDGGLDANYFAIPGTTPMGLHGLVACVDAAITTGAMELHTLDDGPQQEWELSAYDVVFHLPYVEEGATLSLRSRRVTVHALPHSVHTGMVQ